VYSTGNQFESRSTHRLSKFRYFSRLLEANSRLLPSKESWLIISSGNYMSTNYERINQGKYGGRHTLCALERLEIVQSFGRKSWKKDVVMGGKMLLKCILSPSSPVVTICTSGFKVENSAFCPHSVFMIFCMGLRTSSDYFLRHNWFTCFYNTRGIHCAVRTESLSAVEVLFLSVNC